tara:strand:+ start:597 stop:854 length:258 start_codon:yes stop_codon:yes gene_type:complete
MGKFGIEADVTFTFRLEDYYFEQDNLEQIKSDVLSGKIKLEEIISRELDSEELVINSATIDSIPENENQTYKYVFFDEDLLSMID